MKGGPQKYIMLYQRHSFQRVAVMERRVSLLSTNAHRFSLLSRAWRVASRAPSAAPLTSAEDEHQQHVHKHQNRDHRKHHASLDIQGHGAALRADAERGSLVNGLFPARSPPPSLDAKLQSGSEIHHNRCGRNGGGVQKKNVFLFLFTIAFHKGTGRDASSSPSSSSSVCTAISPR